MISWPRANDVDELARMKIEWACTKLSHAFSYCLDTRDYDGLVALFTPDGVWERHGERLEGRQHILKVMHGRPASQFTRHVITNFHFLEVSDTNARATLYNLSWFSFEADNLPVAFVPENALLLDFHDRYSLTDDGWKISEHIIAPIFKARSLLNR